MRHATRATVLIMVGSLAAGCAGKTINHVLADPGRYRNQEVKLSGSVVDSYSVGDNGAYRLKDETGQIWVVSGHGVPRVGATVTVYGTVREGYNIGSVGGKLNLPPGVASGLLLVENSHKAK